MINVKAIPGLIDALMSRLTIFSFLLLLIILPVSRLSGQDLQESAQEAFQTGLDLFEEGLFAESAARFQFAANESESEAVQESANWYLTRTLVRIDSTGIEDHIESFVRRYPNSRHSSEFLADLGHLKMDRGDYAGAVSTFARSLEFRMTNSERAERYYHLAEASVANNSNNDARGYFLELANRFPSSAWSPRALYSRGRLFLEDEDFAGSADAFELLRSRYPDDPMTLRIGTALGEAYYQQERFAEAAQAFSEAIPYLEGDERFKAVYMIAESYNALENLEEAERYYRYYLNRRGAEDPNYREVNYGLAWVFHKQQIYHWAAQSFAAAAVGDDETARKALYYEAVNEKLAGRYGRALERFRDFGSRYSEGTFVEIAYYEWAVTAFEVGRYVEAIETLLPLAQQWESLDDPATILTFLGEAFYANGEYTRALQALDIAANIESLAPARQLQARFQRAWILYFNQVYGDAQPEFERVYQGMQGEALGGEALFWSADSYYQLENWGPAARQYALFIQQYPNHEMVGAANYALGWSYFMMGDFENAIPPLERFMNNYEPPSIALFPYDTDTRLRIGDSWFGLGRYEEAIRYYSMVVNLGSELGVDYAKYQIANSHYRADRNFDAVSEFRSLLRTFPFSSLREQAQYNIAYIYLNSGNYEQAIAEFRTVIERYPNTEWAARAQYNIGDAWYNAGEYAAAIEAYREVLSQYPRSSYINQAINSISYAQLSAGEEDRSTEVLEEFVSENPNSTSADRLRYRQAENYYRQGDYTGSIREFEQYIRITNSDELLPDAWLNLADSYEVTGQTDKAIESYSTLAADHPASEQAAIAINSMAEIEFGRQAYSAAREYYGRLLEKNSRYHHQAYIGIGNVNLSTGQFVQALEAFENAQASMAGSSAARLGIAKVYFQQQRYDEALPIFTQISQNDATEIGAEAMYLSGRIHHLANRLDQAVEVYSRVSVLFEPYGDWVAEAEFRTAEIFIRQGRRGDAIGILNYIIETYPGTGTASRAQNLMPE